MSTAFINPLASDMRNTPQQGFSLIELMISMTISLMLILLITQSALFSHRSFQLNNAQQELLENGWAALHFLRQDIQQADYWGCIENRRSVYNGSHNTTYSPAFAIFGEDNTGINQSDSIRILRVSEPPHFTDRRMQHTGSPIALRQSRIKQHHTVLITNCINGEIFTVTNVSTNQLQHGQASDHTGNMSDQLLHTYPMHSRVYRITGITYELRLSNGIPALYRKHDTDNAQALLENIEQMQILYGENTDNIPGAERFVSIHQVHDTTQIQSVQITLNVRSSEQIQHDNNSQKVRRTFSTVIPIYNRLQHE